ncbi:hypothetical protein CRG98_033709 [Punica granatum]|uniref:Reverse transcriptase Ty1/copia-type domain-containing protein n=1 Tax=Punica granatum TaxID=22663 RepID=A0A2I0IQH7_PUNGR|nr:hypothetical protein CRG98_033709 [Punica granatum]
MKSEIDSMSENPVWDLVNPPEGIVPIGNKWVFKRKIGANGKVETYKARLVAKVMLKSIRIMLAIAAHYDYEVWHMEVKTTFLNGYIEEGIFMDQPRGFESKDKSKAKESRSHQKSKHIEKRYHIIREIIRRGDVTVQKVASADNIADPLTKAMMQQQLEKHLEKMGLRYCTEWL